MFRRFSRCLLFVLASATVLFAQTSTPGPVVIELFTSEGCSSCPPADKMLAQMQAQHMDGDAELILLGEHVDYWNQLGWKDRFSSRSFTARQQEYARLSQTEVYTPELVIDGQPSANNDYHSILRSIDASSKRPKPAQVSLEPAGANQLKVSVDDGGKNNAVLLFITEDNLTTQVKTGENGGTTLHHAAVVREMRTLGKTKNGSFRDTVAIKWDPEWQPNALRFIVLVQEANGAGKVLGAAEVQPKDTSSVGQSTASE